MSDAPDPNAARGFAKDQSVLPTATLRLERRLSIAWLIPFGAVLLAAYLGFRAWQQRGLAVAVHLDDGYGIKAGDDVRYRGITVGKIDVIELESDLHGVLVRARLTSQGEKLARAGSRFWVVRPQFHLTRVEGLETLIGPRFLAVLPAPAPSNGTETGTENESAPRQYHFVGLPEPPVVESIQPGDLEIVLQAAQRGSLHPGAPVSYRQTRIGTIQSVGLSGDAGAVEARAHIQQPFVQLIRPNTRFWDSGGLQAKIGLTGVTIEVDSAEALLTGGVALATPPPPEAGGDVVRTGHRFVLAPKADEDWLKWQPLVAIGNSMLPPGESPPSPLRATIGWRQGRWIERQRTHQGWVLQTPEGLLGPADLLKADEKAERDTVVLEVNGVIVSLTDPPDWERSGLALLKAKVSEPAWPSARTRAAKSPEECLIIADPAATPVPLAASRLTVDAGDSSQWLIDRAIFIDPSLHGACVVARGDGRLIGILLAQEKVAKVALIPQQ